MKSNTIIPDITKKELLSDFEETGDILQLGELYRHYIPLIYGVVLKYLSDRNAAKAAVWNIFDAITESPAEVDTKDFDEWLYTKVKEYCVEQSLKKDNYVNMPDITDDDGMTQEERFPLIDKPHSKEEMDKVTACINQLPEKERRSFHFFYLEDKSYADIADMMGVTTEEVKNHINNGWKALNKIIS